jgi:biopolymer transport protein ExbD
MATLSTPQGSKAVKEHTRKPIIGVDLTAMVDLAFLLITFFMLTTSLSKKNALELAKPDQEVLPDNWIDYPASRTMTILIADNEKLVYYMGEAKSSEMKEATFKEIGDILVKAKTAIAKALENANDKAMYVILKPTPKSVYSNFVDILDEVIIAKVTTYAVDDKYFQAEETAFLYSKKI